MTTASNADCAARAVAGDRERHEDEPALRDRRVRQHADDVRLAQRGEVPEVIDAAASTQRIGCHVSCDGKNPKQTIVSSATKPPAFDATERNAVTGVGAPS